MPSIILAATAVVADEVLALNTACNVRVREEPEHYRAEDSRDSCLGVYFLTRDRSRCSSCSAFTKDTCDGMRANMAFCSTRVLAYTSFTLNHPFANRRIFVACV